MTFDITRRNLSNWRIIKKLIVFYLIQSLKVVFKSYYFRLVLVVGVYVGSNTIISILVNSSFMEIVIQYDEIICNMNFNRFLPIMFVTILCFLMNFKLMIILAPNKFNGMNHSFLIKMCDIIIFGIPILDLMYNALKHNNYCGPIHLRKCSIKNYFKSRIYKCF